MDSTYQPARARSLIYRADIDGLRAIAVLYVVGYHLGNRLVGGFVGVDIFFVISGYLITQVIELDVDRGRFSLLSFYQRRIRRILPALTVMALASTAMAALLFPAAELMDYGESLLAMTGFVSNIYFKHLDPTGGYFGSLSNSQVLLHTWSLSVEEQFYLLYPAALLLFNRLTKRHRSSLFLLCVGLSLAIGFLGTTLRPVASFYLLPTRAWELLLGALLALQSLPPITSRVTREAAALLGLGMIAFGAVTVMRLPVLNALIPCLGAWLILYAGEAGGSFVSRALSLRPVVYVGLISYSLYLWHWPIFVFTGFITAGSDLTRSEQCFELLLSLLLAALSFEYVESPFRRRPLRFSKKRTLWAGVGASAALASLAVALIVSHGVPTRFDAQTRAVLEQNESRRVDWSTRQHECANYRTPISRYSDVVFCDIGHSSSNILFWGDSLTQQLYPVVEHIVPELHGMGAVFAYAAGCPPSEHMSRIEAGYHCDLFNRFTMQRALQGDIGTVFMAFSPWAFSNTRSVCAAVEGRCIGQFSSEEELRRRMTQELSDRIHVLKASGKRVIMSLPFPKYDKDVAEFEIVVALAGRRLAGSSPKQIDTDIIRGQIQTLASDAGAEIYDPRESLCAGESCIYEVGGVSAYLDATHIAASQVGILKQGLLKILEPSPRSITYRDPSPF